MEEKKDAVVIVDDKQQKVTESQIKAFIPILKDFIGEYRKHKDEIDNRYWLFESMKRHLPEQDDEQLKEWVEGVVTTVDIQNAKRDELKQAKANGQSREAWLTNEVEYTVDNGKISSIAVGGSAPTTQAVFSQIDTALSNANEKLLGTLLTNNGVVSQNPNLNGYIAEQYHAQTFNMNAVAKGSPYRAEVVEPEGVYIKNGVDVVIRDADGNIIDCYQFKYGKDANATKLMYEAGDYNDQILGVPADQKAELEAGGIRCADVIEAPDGTTSDKLTQEQSKDLQEKAQKENLDNTNFDYNVIDNVRIAKIIGRQVGFATLLGATFRAGIYIIDKALKGEKIDTDELIEETLKTGFDAGLKSAVACSLKVAIEKGIIFNALKGTPIGIITTAVCSALENIKTILKLARGEITLGEAVEEMADTICSTIIGTILAGKGAALGAVFGTVFGPVGTFVGGLVGGLVGYMAGSKIGSLVASGIKKVGEYAGKLLPKTFEVAKAVATTFINGVKSVAKTCVNIVRNVGNAVVTGAESFFSGVTNFVNSMFA
jgi:hypothetical protein